MIELLIVITLIAILGATALPAFLDLRNEARAAALRQMLATMRVGIKNQVLQARLKCGTTGDPNVPPISFQAPFYSRLFENILRGNSITGFYTNTSYKICTPSDIPNQSDRYFWDLLPDNQRAHYVSLGSDIGPLNSYFFINPFQTPVGVTGYDHPAIAVSQVNIDARGGQCGWVNYYNSPNYHAHWYFNADTGEIFAGTNTPGINECNF